MNRTKQPSSLKIYLVFLIAVLIITAASTLAQSIQTNTEFNMVSTTPSGCEIVELPENFDYTHLKIEIYGSNSKVLHCYVCYAITERSFAIDLTSFENGDYSIHVMNGESTYYKNMTVSK